jgi:3-oxoacyl-[acyl-carrier-protein] synthase-3
VIRSHVIGCGAYLPKTVLTNHDLAKRVDTSDEWIVARTGIRERHVAGPGEKTSDLAVEAAHAALANAGAAAGDLDLIVCATTTPDETFPSVATKLQMRLGMTRGAAFDVQAVCSGFVYGLAVADNFIRCGQAQTVLLVGAECMTRLLDWNDRTTCVLFGDGAGAIVLEAGPSDGKLTSSGVISTQLRSDGRHRAKLYVDGGPSTTKTVGHLRMEGREVFKHAVGMVTDVIKACFDDAGVTAADIDWFVPHQANRRIIDASADKLGLPREKVVVTVDRHGNTSAASIPLALDVAVKDGRIKKGDLVMIEAMGGGFTWGAALIRW